MMCIFLKIFTEDPVFEIQRRVYGEDEGTYGSKICYNLFLPFQSVNLCKEQQSEVEAMNYLKVALWKSRRPNIMQHIFFFLW